jgi:glycosyltransferase involved in cell wall biosynthesis
MKYGVEFQLDLSSIALNCGVEKQSNFITFLERAVTVNLSVIICTHNPRQDYISQVLDSLEQQTLDRNDWELLIIDNASKIPLDTILKLSWHPQAKIIREEQLGLTPARLRGIREAGTEVLIFVDDDNVLDREYLEYALKYAKEWPMLGAWGGQTQPKFEIEPPAWTEDYWQYLGIRSFNGDCWSSLPQWEATPIGAGMCVRKSVADRYAGSLQSDPQRQNLDRQGNLLLSCGDMDFAYTACDMGLGIGIFASLKLLHMMPPGRLEEAYLLRLVEQSVYSRVMLYFLRENQTKQVSWKEKLKLVLPFAIYPKNWGLAPRERRFKEASDRGYNLAIKAILDRK